tara:strand:- start:289 stop:648 length:360 start_codon:yes stop_codon:yes gene_type:complete
MKESVNYNIIFQNIDNDIYHIKRIIQSCNLYKIINISTVIDKNIMKIIKHYRKNLFNNPDIKCIGPIYLTILRMKIENLQVILNNKNYYFSNGKMNELLENGIDKCNQYMEIIDSYINV